MKIVTWNVNSIRARLEHLTDWLKSSRPDIVLLQETKCEEIAFPKALLEDLGYNIALSGQKSYNGVAILSKYPLEDVRRGLPAFPEDENARYIEAVAANFRVASVYVPNGNTVGSEKYQYKLKFLDNLCSHMATLLLFEEACIIGGDYNIAPEDRDVHNPQAWEGEVLCSVPERQQFQSLLHLGYYDALRLQDKDSSSAKGPFTWWDYRKGAWQNDEGLRIDHLLLSPMAADRLQAAGVEKEPRGWDKPSDHAPVWGTF